MELACSRAQLVVFRCLVYQSSGIADHRIRRILYVVSNDNACGDGGNGDDGDGGDGDGSRNDDGDVCDGDV
ncbi:hypothetical protein J40TS1_21840 [Paenibacillus montaniterrae]|uniref:Uncharacterized protein n=1 Tax=Paenibacillus montaniterrae TaxID=429341 RepID=A0A919YNQ8_9BACL|nr:hypothetical protein J40TS1_21840 [Paenibacillus montaniterrae]